MLLALPVLSSSGVKFRRVLAHFPQELSLAFAYGSGVFRQAGASAGYGEVSAAASSSPGRPLGVTPPAAAVCGGDGRREGRRGRGPCAFRLAAWRWRSALPGAASGPVVVACARKGAKNSKSVTK